MDQPLPASTIAHLIQLAIAPVFLLAGILLFLAEIRLAARFVDIRRELLPPPAPASVWRRRSTGD